MAVWNNISISSVQTPSQQLFYNSRLGIEKIVQVGKGFLFINYLGTIYLIFEQFLKI